MGSRITLTFLHWRFCFLPQNPLFNESFRIPWFKQIVRIQPGISQLHTGPTVVQLLLILHFLIGY